MAKEIKQKRVPYSERKYVKFATKFQTECKRYKEAMVKDETEAAQIKAIILSAYGENGNDMPERTFYNQLEKQYPGLRKRRFDAGKEKKKLPKSVGKIVTEVMLAGKSKKDAVKIAEKKTGVEISAHKVLSIKTDKVVSESVFGVDMKKFVSEIFELDNMAPGAFIIIKVGKHKFEVHYEDLQDIKLILANAFNRSVEDRHKIRIDKSQIRDIMVGELFENQITVAKSDGDLKSVGALVTMQKKLKIKDTVVSPNLKLAYEAAREFKKDLTMPEYISMIKLLSRGENANG